MFEELAELVLSPLGLVLLVILGAGRTEEGRKAMRKAAKNAVKAGYYLRERGNELVDEVREQTSDMVAEVKAEIAQGNGNRRAEVKKTLGSSKKEASE